MSVREICLQDRPSDGRSGASSVRKTCLPHRSSNGKSGTLSVRKTCFPCKPSNGNIGAQLGTQLPQDHHQYWRHWSLVSKKHSYFTVHLMAKLRPCQQGRPTYLTDSLTVTVGPCQFRRHVYLILVIDYLVAEAGPCQYGERHV